MGNQAEFGPFRFFPAERRLLKGETPVQVGSRELDILIALVERAGEVVTKRELFARVWPDVIVEESSLRVHIAGLRKVLSDGNDQTRYIVNVPGRGYSFVASLTGTKAPATRIWARELPRNAARIIGRDGDIIAVAELVAKHRFVTVVGPGGVGKTTLGLAVANAYSEAFADGVCFVDLSLNVGGQAVADSVVSALELVAKASNPTASILDHIRDREMMLILDSCETAVSDAAALAESIIQQGPHVSILATSREPLRARSEHVYLLEPLSFPPEGTLATKADLLAFSAAELFCERAAAAGYRAEFRDADAVVIGDICRKVDGNALALELAASRVGTYGLRQTAELLDSHMKLTWRGRRTAPPRHQTLTAMLDWSYALIDERERAVLRQLSVFVGGFGLDEARGVAGEGDEVIDALEQLVLKSLISVDTRGPSPRYRLLDSTRIYAGTKLRETGAAREVLRRHARHYLDWLTRSTTVASVPLEHASNVRAALEWALSPGGDPYIGVGLATYACELFLRLGMVTECLRWSERALETLSPERAGTLQAIALRAAQGPDTTIGHGDRLRKTLESALSPGDVPDDTQHQFRLLSALYVYHRRAGALEGLIPIAERAAQIAPLLADMAPTIAAQAMLGAAHHLNGNLTESHAILIAVRDAQLGAGAVTNFYGFQRDAEVMIARTQWLQGFPDRAALTVAHANRTDEQRDPVTQCLGLMWGVSVHHGRGDWATTDDYIERMLTLASDYGLLPYKWFAMALRGDLQARRGDATAGISNLVEYSRRLTDGGYDINAHWLACCLAEALANNQQVEQACRVLEEFNPNTATRTDAYMPEFLRVRGAVLAKSGNESAAVRAFLSSLEMSDAQGALSWRLRTVSSQARLHLTQSRLSQARKPLIEAYGRFTEGFETLDLRLARALIEEIDARAGAIVPN